MSLSDIGVVSVIVALSRHIHTVLLTMADTQVCKSIASSQFKAPLCRVFTFFLPRDTFSSWMLADPR
jgi:hypothetical protein